MKQVRNRSLRGFVVTMAIGTASVGVHAQTSFSLPAQPLGSAISELARESGANILVPADLVAGRAAPALTGKYDVGDASHDLLLKTLSAVAPVKVTIKPDGTAVNSRR